MAFGIEIKNGQNVTVVSSESFPLVVSDWSATFNDWSTWNSDYTKMVIPRRPFEIVGFQITSGMKKIFFQYDHSQLVSTAAAWVPTDLTVEWFSNSAPVAFRSLISSDRAGSSGATFGMAIYGPSGALAFDTGRQFVTSEGNIDIKYNTNFTLANGSWFFPLFGSQRKGSPSWNSSISRTSSGTSVWTGAIDFVTGSLTSEDYPSSGTIIRGLKVTI